MFRSKTYKLFTKSEGTDFGKFADPFGRTVTDQVVTFPPNIPNPQNVRLMNTTWEVTPETEDSTFLTGTAAQSYDLIGKRPSKISFEMLMSPAEFSKSTASNSLHIFEGEDFYNAVGAEIVEATSATDINLLDTPLQRIIYPSKSAWSKSISQSGVVQNVATGIGKGLDFNGVMGTAVISTAGVGKPVNIKFDMQGGSDGLAVNNGEDYDISEADMAKLVFDPSNIIDGIANKYMNAKVIIIKSEKYKLAQSFDIDDYAAGDAIEVCTSTMELNLGNEVNPVDCQAKYSGLQGFTITDAKPTLKINPFMTTKSMIGTGPAKSAFDFFKGLVREQTFVIAITYGGFNTKDGAEYTPLQIVIPNAQIQSMPTTEDNTLLRYDITFKCLGNWNEVEPIFTDTLYTFPTSIKRFELAWWMIVTEDYVADIA